MPDRAWERGLHQMVEAKEGCSLTGAREQLGRLTYQRFFSRYLRLGGMSGTVREVSRELWSVYGLGVRRIPLHRPSRRRQLPGRIYPAALQKWAAVIESAGKLSKKGQPMLIGTGSVADSESVSLKLTAAGIEHRVLNARQDKDEADIVARAGQRGQVTVATNMAGRGTDIPLGKDVAKLGGLHIIAACCNEAGRIDRQLYGRCARQGDPGSYQVMLSLQDDLLLQNLPGFVLILLQRYTIVRLPFHGLMNRLAMKLAQKKVEKRYYRARKVLLKLDRQFTRTLAFSGNLE